MHLTRAAKALSCFLAVASAVSVFEDGSDVEFDGDFVQNGTARIHQVARGPGMPGPIALEAVYVKYGKKAPDYVVEAAKKQKGRVVAKDLPNDISYNSPVKIGKSVVNLDFDTGSSDLWSFSKLQPAKQRKGHSFYKLSGKRAGGESWSIVYGDGSRARGKVYVDKVSVGGVHVTQAVEAASFASSSFVTGSRDGILGLGFGDINNCKPKKCYTFMHQAGPTLVKDLFTATLKKGKNGFYDFGFIDHKAYTGSIGYAPVNHKASPGFWEVTVGGYAIGKGGKRGGSFQAIFDTGTSLINIPASAAKAFYSKVPSAHVSRAAGGYIFKCSQAHKLPNLSFYFNGHRRTMPGSYGNYAKLTSPKGYCFGGVQPDSGIGFAILGDVFIKSQFIVFDRKPQRVGIAHQKGVHL